MMPMMVAITSDLRRQHGKRCIGQQRIAGTDAIDEPIDEAVDARKTNRALGDRCAGT